MHYTMDGRVRYSEVDSEGTLTIDGLINYLQDTCMLQSEEKGVGYRYLTENHVAWFLTSWQIQILRMPKLYEKIIVTTNPYDMKSFYGYRNFWIDTLDGERLVQANSIWVYLNTDNMMPKRVPQTEVDAYGPYEPRLEMDYAPRKMKVEGDFAPVDPIPVRADMIDTNHHVNNCQYIKTAMEAAGLTQIPREIRAEYRKQARLGDTFCPKIARTENEITVDLQDLEGESYTPVKFIL